MANPAAMPIPNFKDPNLTRQLQAHKEQIENLKTLITTLQTQVALLKTKVK